MLTESGRVIALEDDGLWVETIRSTTCNSCGARKACGHGLMNSVSDGKRGYIRVLPGEVALSECRLGDQVLISLPEEVILRGSLIAYLLPLVCMLTGAFAFTRLFAGNPDLLAAAGAVVGLVVGFGLVHLHGRRHAADPHFQPVLLKVMPAGANAIAVS